MTSSYLHENVILTKRRCVIINKYKDHMLKTYKVQGANIKFHEMPIRV